MQTHQTVTDYTERARDLCEQALRFIETHKVQPTPENYAIWFHYVWGNNPELKKEVDLIIRNGMPFSDHTNAYLHNKYVVADKNEKTIAKATTGAAHVLGEVLRVVNEFGQETSSYNQDIDSYIQEVSMDIKDQGVQALVKDLISATANIRQRGESLSSRLEASKSEIQELRKNLEEVTHESQRDFLTGVLNRKALNNMLDIFIEEAKNSKEGLCLLMIDIDHFKQFNDRFGHLLGDEVLKIVARALTYCVRGKDIVARYGGEEFCVLLPGTPMIGAEKVAETIRTTIAKRDLKRKDTGESYGSITVSIGIASFRVGEDTDESLMKRADQALYTSKKEGRNRITVESK